MRRRSSTVLIAGLAALVVAGCASAAAGNSAAMPSPSPMPVLGPAALPDLPYTTKPLTAGELAKDASIPGLSSKIVSLGYLGGRKRTFQGESKHLTLADSRFLLFKDAAGAAKFVEFVHANAASYFGGALGEQRVTVSGQAGWLFTLAPCACHLANPALVGVVHSGSGVAWLEINGPDATAALLVTLLDPSNDTLA